MSGPAPSGSSPLAAAFQAASEPVSVRDALAMGGQQQQGGEGEMTQSQLIRLGRTTPAGSIQTGTQRIEVEVPVYTDVHYEDVVAERTVPLHVQKIVPEPEVHELVRQVPELSHSWIERQVEVPVVQHVERIVEVPQVQVVNKYVPKVEVKTIERVVPKTVVKTVDRVEEVPVVQYKDKIVEVPHVVEVIKEVPKPVPVEVQVPVIKYVPKVEVKTIERIEHVPVPQYVDVPVPVIKEVPKIITEERVVDVEVPGPVIEVWREVPVEREEVIEREVEVVKYVDVPKPYEVPVYDYKHNKYPVVIPHEKTTMLPPGPTNFVIPSIIKGNFTFDIPPGMRITREELVHYVRATKGIDLNQCKEIAPPMPLPEGTAPTSIEAHFENEPLPEYVKNAKPWPVDEWGPLPDPSQMQDGHSWTGPPVKVGEPIKTTLQGPPQGWIPNQHQLKIMAEHKLTPEQCGYQGPPIRMPMLMAPPPPFPGAGRPFAPPPAAPAGPPMVMMMRPPMVPPPPAHMIAPKKKSSTKKSCGVGFFGWFTGSKK